MDSSWGFPCRGRHEPARWRTAIVALTILWAFVNARSNLAWALVLRIIAPIVLLIATLLVIPTMARAPNRRRLAGIGVGAPLIGTALLFTVLV